MRKKNRLIIFIIFMATACLLLIAALLIANYHSFAKEGENGWYTEGDARYYAREDGKKAKGYCLIDGEPYYFDWQGKAENMGWIRNKYYCTGKGKLATGWRYMDGRAYYFYRDVDDSKIGRMAKNYTTSGGLTIPEEGYMEGDEAKAIGYAINVLERYGWDLENAYRYSSSLEFVRGANEHYGYRIHKCALQGFRYGKGNCLAWAGTFCTMAKVMGYDCRLIWGTLQFRGENVVHGWTEIWEDDGPHVYDPRHGGGGDFSGFNVRYGEKGTYRYNEDSKKYLKW